MRRPAQGGTLRLALLVAFLISAGAYGRNYAPEECPAIGNSESGIYHMNGDRNYRQMLRENKNKKKDNRVCFKSAAAAENASYRRSMSSKSKK